MFINLDQVDTLSISDGNRVFKLGPYMMAHAIVKSGTSYFIWQTNYAIGLPTTGGAGNVVETCPDGCKNDGVVASDAATATATVPGITAAQQTTFDYYLASGHSANCDFTLSGCTR